MIKEVWQSVVGYEGVYEVSSRGNIRSITRNTLRGATRVVRNGKPLKPHYNHDGYAVVCLYKCGASKSKLIHNLVMEAFVGPKSVGMEVCHFDGDPSNNRITNLRYDTPSNNMLDAVRHGTRLNRKVYRSDGVSYSYVGLAATAMGGNERSIRTAILQRHRAYGFHWSYQDDFHLTKFKPTQKKVAIRSDGKTYESISDAAVSSGVSHKAIRQAIDRGWKSAGYHWKLQEDQHA